MALIPPIVKEVLSLVQTGAVATNAIEKIDPRFFDYHNWKPDEYGHLVNTFCTFFTGDSLTAENFEEVTLFGVNINISNTPTIIETRLKGFDYSVFQHFTNNNYDISVSSTEVGPLWVQQNSKKLTQITNMLRKGESLNVVNPQLNLTYGIYKVICTGHNIGQDPKFYSVNPVSFSLKSDTDIDIFKPIKEGVPSITLS